MDGNLIESADRIIRICEVLKVLSNDSTFKSYRDKLFAKLQRLALDLGEFQFREDAKLMDVAFITTENGVHVPIKEGKAVGGPLEGMDFSKAESSEGKGKNVSGHYSSPYPIEEISARGVNKPCKGFSEKGLKKHKESRHKEQYAHLTDEQYEKRAIRLLSKKCGEHIDGYRCSDGAVCRFNKLTGEYAKGYPGGDIKTCFYPTDPKSEDRTKIDLDYARRYFDREKERESYDK